MDRLTRRNADGTVCLANSETMFFDVLNHLAEYEDAEEQGRLVHVVRCKECRHSKEELGVQADELLLCERHTEEPMPELGEKWSQGYRFRVFPDGFCSDGEARADAEAALAKMEGG